MLKVSVRFLSLLLVMLVCVPAYSYAQCTSPAGEAGGREWFSGDSKYKICNGTDWLDMSCHYVGGCTPTSLAYEAKVSDTLGSNASVIMDDGTTLVVFSQWSGLWVLDVSSSPSAPTVDESQYNNAAYSDTNDVATYGDYVFSAGRAGSGLVSTDVSTPTAPSLSDTLLSSPSNEMTNLWGVDVTSDGQYAVTASWQSGSNNECHIHVIDISDPTAMTFPTGGTGGHTDFSAVTGANVYCTDVAIYGDYAFVSFDTVPAGIGVVDISTKNAPSAVAYVDATNGDGAYNIRISEDGDYAFLANQRDDSITSFDISTPTSPTEADYYQNITYLDGVARIDISGDVLVGHGENANSVVALDISDPTAMTLIDTYQSATNTPTAFSVSVADRYVYVGSYGSSNMTVLDLGCDASSVCNTLGACSTAAEFEWDGTENAYRYCDGANWIQTGCNVDTCFDLGACSTAAEIRYQGGELQQCDGTNWQPMTE